MELSKAARPTPLIACGRRWVGPSVPELAGGKGAAAGGGGGGGGGGNADNPAVEGGAGDEGDVRGELAPDPELLELLYFVECSSLFSMADRFDFLRAKIFLFFLSSSEPW